LPNIIYPLKRILLQQLLSLEGVTVTLGEGSKYKLDKLVIPSLNTNSCSPILFGGCIVAVGALHTTFCIVLYGNPALEVKPSDEFESNMRRIETELASGQN
jgi:hypothetical protein